MSHIKEAYDAIKWNYKNLDEILSFGTEVIDLGCVPTTKGGIEHWPLQVKTEEGNVVMEYDNWLIRCEDGTYYVRKTVQISF